MMASPESEFPQKMHRLERLIREADRLADPAAKSLVRDVAQAVLELHRDGLERLMERIAAAEPGENLLAFCGEDELIGGLLVLHDLHPLDVEDRVEQALLHLDLPGRVELLEITAETVRLRFEGTGDRDSENEVRPAIERAIGLRVPEITRIQIEGLEEAEESTGRFALTVL